MYWTAYMFGLPPPRKINALKTYSDGVTMRKIPNDYQLFSVFYENSSHRGTVLNGLHALLEQENLIDVILVVEREEFKAHKVVLASCSDYFRAMFTDNMIEAHKKRIHLNHMKRTSFRLVFEYIYTGKIILSLANVQDVLEVASYLQIWALVQTCSDYLATQIDMENCMDITTIAETYSLHDLKMEGYRFMNENLTKFSKTSEFFMLTFNQLRVLLACDMPVDCTESEVMKAVFSWFFHQKKSNPNQDMSCAAVILPYVHFIDIPIINIRSMLQQINADNNGDWQLYRIAETEIQKQLNCLDRPTLTNLVNPRGLQLAILSIGGFKLTGMTNEITYKFIDDDEWKHLTKIPHVEQCGFGAVVLNNELYVIGGCFNQSMEETVHPFGFKYNPMQNQWTTFSAMNVERCRFSLHLLGGKMYAIGGVTEIEEFASNITRACECYDPELDQWQVMETLPNHLTQHAGASYETSSSSKIFICGGIERDTTNSLDTMYCYNVEHKNWTTCAPMLTPRADHVMLSIDNKLYVCGGWQEDSETAFRRLVTTIDVYDVETDSWRVVTTVPSPKFHTSIISYFRTIYFIGGFHSDSTVDRNTATIECYDIDDDVWSTEDRYPQDIWEHTSALMYIPRTRNSTNVVNQNENMS